MKESSKHIALIHKSLTGQLSSDDDNTLKLWLAESDEHQQIAEDVKSVWIASESYLADTSPNMAKGLSRLRASIENEQIKSVAPPKPSILRYLSKVAVAAAMVAGLFMAWNNFNQPDANSEIVSTEAEGRTDIALEDGTLVYINGSSTLEKPLTFDKDIRMVTLEGEAFFEIEKDASRPFFVSTKNFDLEVLGTAFNVYAPNKGNLQEVVVDHGTVRLTIPKTKESFILEKGDRFVYNTKTQLADTSKDDRQNAQSWRTGKLEFQNTKLKDVIFSLEKHFDININCKNESLLECPITSTFQDADVEDVINTIKTIFDFDIKHRKGSKSYKLSSGSCKN